MKKNTYYFTHDYNASSDTKILYMRNDLGMEGYGCYWFIIESLANAGGILPLKIIPVLAKQMDVSAAKVEAVVKNYELFNVSDSQFFSERLLNHLELRLVLSDKGKKGASLRWKNGEANREANGEAIATLMQKKGKEIKGKETKLNIKGKYFKFNEIINLPSNYIQSIQEQLYTLQKKKVDESVILKLWESFRLEKLTGEIFYNSENEFYKHFVNWIKIQKFVDDGKSESDKRIEAMANYADRYR